MEHVHTGHDSLKSKIAIIAATTILLSGAALIEHYCSLPLWQLLLIYLVPYLLVGHDTLKEAAEGIVAGDVFNEDFLMTIATIGALCIGFMPGADTEFAEAVFVMLFFQIGELFEEYAEGRSRDSISHLMEIRPDTAHVERNGDEMTVAPEEVAVGETIIVKPGEKVPLDGIVVSGTSSLNTVALTGESMPREISKGDDISSGCTQSLRVAARQDDKDFRRKHRRKNHRPCGKCQREQVAQRIVHNQIRTRLHTCRCHRRPDSRLSAAIAFISDFHRLVHHMASPGVDILGGVVSMRIGNKRAADIFRRTRRSVAQRHTDKRQQLHRHIVAAGNSGV